MGGSCQFHRLLALWINKLAGRFGRSSLQCPVAANSIASQVVKNGAHKTGGRESTRLVNKELSDRWKIPIPEGHSISKPFKLEELAALRRLKPEKSPRLYSTFPEFILHAGSALKFLITISSLPACVSLKFQRSGEEH